jgi:UDP-4-amino-4,6-dideoxy-N-acetyl-beta-L-altrosamine transaminase
MAERSYPYGRQSISEADVARVSAALTSDFLTTGPAVRAFEDGLCRATGAGHAVAVSSGTAALHAAYHVLGLGPGDELLTSPLSFAATANAALYCGAEVRFADVERDTGLIDPVAVEAAITPRTRALVAVDYAGQPADYDALRAIAERRGLALVADAAHSLGARLRGRPVGTLADLSCTSFHPVKPITTGEGGAILVDDADRAARLRRFRSHGIEAPAPESEEPWLGRQVELGFNYRITDLQCALGSSQLERLEAFVGRRAALAARYDAALARIPGLVRPTLRPDRSSGWHLYVVEVPAEDRRRVYLALHAAGVKVQVHYVPIYRHPFYAARGHRPGACPNAEARYAGSLSLPLYPELGDDDLDTIVDRLARVLSAG